MVLTCLFPAPISKGAWHVLSTALGYEPKIDSGRNTPENLKDLYQRSLAALLMEGNAPVGFIAAWPVAEGFIEIGSVWIHPDYRHQGLSHQIYDAILLFKGVGQQIAFGVTTNPISVHVGHRVGLEVTENWDDPIPQHLTCGPCEIVSSENQPTCEKRNKTCWLRIRKNT